MLWFTAMHQLHCRQLSVFSISSFTEHVCLSGKTLAELGLRTSK